MEATMSPRRSKATWKPRVAEGDPLFLRCAEGTALWLGDREAEESFDAWRSAIVEPAYLTDESSVAGDARRLHPAAELPAGVSVHYRFVGGFNAPAIEVFWTGSADISAPRWVALKTFTGLQVKYPTPSKRPPLVFGLADEDAYCYCDLDPCEECVAACRRGFVLYALFADDLLVKVPCGR